MGRVRGGGGKTWTKSKKSLERRAFRAELNAEVALCAMLFAFLEDPHEPEKVISG
jgi:hypothetical protein